MAGEELLGERKSRTSMVTNTGYWFTDSSINTPMAMASQLQQSFEPNPEIYNLNTGMEMMDMWKTNFFNKAAENMVVGGTGGGGGGCVWVDDDLSLRLVDSSSSSGKAEINLSRSSGEFFQIRSSKYLVPAQELLKEFCCLGTKQLSDDPHRLKITKPNSQWQDDEQNTAEKLSLGSLHFTELQKRKSKLLHMLDEVDRRYKHYCDQMRGVVCSFETVAGSGSATVYSAMASKVMSRHFRCLRDGILSQIKAASKAMAEKDSSMAPPGATKGETPSLKVVDQTLRQHKAFQQLTMMDTHPWRPQRGLPERSVSVLRAWLFDHFLHPYPNDVDKHILARQTGLSRSQVSNWFINARVRLWKPMVEEMYLEEIKEQEDNTVGSIGGSRAVNASTLDKKPNLVRLDSDCISSIINISEKTQPSRGGDHRFVAADLDFSSYNHHSSAAGVSLTLGLPFSSTSQNSLFYPPREQIEECQPVQYLMAGSQLLHDLAGQAPKGINF